MKVVHHNWDWRVEADVTGPCQVMYSVRKALGPFPLRNWSWSSLYTTYDEADAIRWADAAAETDRLLHSERRHPRRQVVPAGRQLAQVAQPAWLAACGARSIGPEYDSTKWVG